MKIKILDAKDAEHIRLPLWSDEAIQEANNEKIITQFIKTGDASILAIPDGATIFTIKALSAKEMSKAVRKAGRIPHLGSVIQSRKAKEIERIKEACGGIDKPEGATAFARWLDELDEDEAKSIEEYSLYENKKNEQLTYAGVVKVEHPDMTFDSVQEFLMRIPSPALQESIVTEMGYRVQSYSGLGTRPKGL